MPATARSSLVTASDIVGMAHYLDLRLTVPGGAVLPMAGVTIVGVAPTHRRRGILRTMYTELHNRIADARYPIAGLTASEGGIYGRFGYGPATIEQEFSVDRRSARFRDEAPDPGGVRIVKPADHRDELAEIYERWRTGHRAAWSAPRRYGTNYWPIASRVDAAEPSCSRSCIPTAMPCTGCSATTRCSCGSVN